MNVWHWTFSTNLKIISRNTQIDTLNSPNMYYELIRSFHSQFEYLYRKVCKGFRRYRSCRTDTVSALLHIHRFGCVLSGSWLAEFETRSSHRSEGYTVLLHPRYMHFWSGAAATLCNILIYFRFHKANASNAAIIILLGALERSLKKENEKQANPDSGPSKWCLSHV